MADVWLDIREIRDTLRPSARALFEVLVPYAISGDPCPTSKELEKEHLISHHMSGRLFAELVRAGAIASTYYGIPGRAGQFRHVIILVGVHAGKATLKGGGRECPAPNQVGARPPRPKQPNRDHQSDLMIRRAKPSFRPEDMVAHGKPHCFYCGKEMKIATTEAAWNDVCSNECRRKLIRHGYATKVQVEARLARLAEPKPRGCFTVEEWLAAGGTIYSEPGFTSLADFGGNPVSPVVQRGNTGSKRITL